MLKSLEFAHALLAEIIQPGDVVVDATMGNGYDTLFLANLTDQVYAFDVQEAALTKTQKRLAAAGKSAHLILDGHEKCEKYVKSHIKAAIFNLGYLPQTDKAVITRAETTLQALASMTEKLVVGGRIVLMIYWGHAGGEMEKNAVLKWAQALPQADWEVFTWQAQNEIHEPPILLALEKRPPRRQKNQES